MSSIQHDSYGSRLVTKPRDHQFVYTHTVAADTLTYTRANGALAATGVDNIATSPSGVGRLYVVLFVESDAAIDALVGAADAETITLAVTWKNSLSARYGDTVYSTIRAAETSETPSGFSNPICRVESPRHFVDQWGYTITLSSAMDDALDTLELKVGLDWE